MNGSLATRLRRGLVATAVVAAAAVALVPGDARAATLPTGFTERQVAGGLDSPTVMAVAPGNRVFVAEQRGRLRVVRNGAFLPTPFATLTVNADNERGLIGVAVDPNFTTNRWVYLYYTATTPTIHNRVSRFTADASLDKAVPNSERVLMDLEPLGANIHNGGSMSFGPDGRLYVAVGENNMPSKAQQLDNRLGKILRINKDGTIPSSNPFYTQTTGANRSIWALGLRNPFTFDIHRGTGRMLIGDVGAFSVEEINEGVAGGNFGWPVHEGPDGGDSRFVDPVYSYPHVSGETGECAITGGAFYDPATARFPAAYHGDYFFADYCAGWIKRYDPVTDTAATFAQTGTPAQRPSYIVVADDGSLYYLLRPGGGDDKVFQVTFTGNPAPEITDHPDDRVVSIGEPATFQVAASGATPLGYQWQRNGVDIPGATADSYSILSPGLTDSGARFRARVSNGSGNATSNEAVLTVLSGSGPSAQIDTPPGGTTYAAGTSVSYSGDAVDGNGNPLPASALTWQVVFHHEDHTHPVQGPDTGVTGGSFSIPARDHTETDVFYRVNLTARQPDGRTSTASRDLTPRTSTLRIQTSPPGLAATLDGVPQTAPITVTSVEGVVRELGAPSPQVVGGTTYELVRWSDGGGEYHDVTTPVPDTTYTAEFRVVPERHVNFQPAAAPVPPGYVADGGAAFGPRGNGHTYGWTGNNTAQARDRNSPASPDQRYDTLILMQAPARPDERWEIAVGDGRYDVHLVAGDPTATNSVYRLLVEGTLAVDGTPSPSRPWIEGTVTVHVTDGRLTVANAPGSSNNKVAFIDIAPAAK